MLLPVQAWRSEEHDLGKNRDPAEAVKEACILDLASGLEGRTRIETVKVKLLEEIRRLHGLV